MQVKNKEDVTAVLIRSESDPQYFIGYEGSEFCPVPSGPQSIWKLKHVDAKNVVFYYEVNPDSRESDRNPRGFHWNCENNNIVLQYNYRNWEQDYTNQFQFDTDYQDRPHAIKLKVVIPVHKLHVHIDVSTPIISTHDNEERYVQYSQTGSTICLYLVDRFDTRQNSNLVFIIDPTDIFASKL